MPPSLSGAGVKVAVLQVSALVDHVCVVERSTLTRLVGDELAGSRRCSLDALQSILASVGEFHSKAGGSASNVGRALATGFGVQVQLVGTRGSDEWGVMYTSSMRRAGVNTERVRVAQEGSTGRSAILTCDGERTMRTFMDPRVTTRAADLSPDDFAGCNWVFLSAYALYSEGLLQRAAELAVQVGARVVLDLASYEVVRSYYSQLQEVLASGNIYCCICNEDEAESFIKAAAAANHHHPTQPGAPPSPSSAAAAGAPFEPADPGHPHMPSPQATAAQPQSTQAQSQFTQSQQQQALQQQHQAAVRDALVEAGYPPDSSLPGTVLRLLLRHVAVAVVTRGVLGCVAARRGEGTGEQQQQQRQQGGGPQQQQQGVQGDEEDGEIGELRAVPAVPGVAVVDTTGAGDHFTAGFMYGVMTGQPLERCCEVGCLTGASAVRVVGAELGSTDWQWFHARLHGDLAADVVQDSAAEVAQELLGCYSLIGRLGRGAVYFGSARLAQGSAYWERAVRLAERVSLLLGTPVWTGGGPGMMRAASEGGLRAGVPVGGIRISREAGTNVLTMEDYLSAGCAFTCCSLPARKVALTDAGSRLSPDQRTAFLFLPGGLGTMDELFSILTLMQLGKLGSRLPVPLVVVNWDGFYDGLMALLQAFDRSGALKAAEVREVMVAGTIQQVLEYLATFYGLPVPDAEPDPWVGGGGSAGEAQAALEAADGDREDTLWVDEGQRAGGEAGSSEAEVEVEELGGEGATPLGAPGTPLRPTTPREGGGAGAGGRGVGGRSVMAVHSAGVSHSSSGLREGACPSEGGLGAAEVGRVAGRLAELRTAGGAGGSPLHPGSSGSGHGSHHRPWHHLHTGSGHAGSGVGLGALGGGGAGGGASGRASGAATPLSAAAHAVSAEELIAMWPVVDAVQLG